MRKNIVKLMMAGLVSTVLFGCGSGSATGATTAESSMMESESTTKEAMKEDETMLNSQEDDMMAEDVDYDVFGAANLENGVVKEIDNGFVRIERTDEQMSGGESDEQSKELDLTMSSRGFYLIDMVTGSASTDLKAGDEIFAWVSPQYTASLPPQVGAYVILTNTKDKNANVPMYTDAIEKVEETSEGIVLKDTANNAEWQFDSSVKPVLASTNEETEFSNIEKGDKCLIWAEAFMLSKDSQKPTGVKAQKIVILK